MIALLVLKMACHWFGLSLRLGYLDYYCGETPFPLRQWAADYWNHDLRSLQTALDQSSSSEGNVKTEQLQVSAATGFSAAFI